MAAFLLQEGVFTQVSDDLTVYVRSRDPDGTLRGILVDDGRDKTAHATILAESGRLTEGPNGPRVLLVNGSRQEIDHQTGRLNVLTFGQNEIDLSDNQGDCRRTPARHDGDVAGRTARPASAQSARRAEMDRRRAQAPGDTAHRDLLCLHRRCSSVLSGTFRRHGSFVRPLVAVAAMVALLAFGLAMENLAARDNAMLPMIWLQAVAPGMICGWMLFGPQWLAVTPPTCRGHLSA